MTGYETILREIEARMKAGPPLAAAAEIRRAHRTDIPDGVAFAIHVIDGADRRAKGSACGRQCYPSVSLFARSDAGVGATDTLRAAVYTRLVAGWPSGIAITVGAITPETEIANKDAVRVDIELEFAYDTTDQFSLEMAA